MVVQLPTRPLQRLPLHPSDTGAEQPEKSPKKMPSSLQGERSSPSAPPPPPRLPLEPVTPFEQGEAELKMCKEVGAPTPKPNDPGWGASGCSGDPAGVQGGGRTPES